MCGEGGEVFMVPIQWGQRKPKWPTHKDPGKKRKKRKAQQRNIANGVVRGSHGHRRAGLTRGSHGWRTKDPWMMH